MTVGQNNPDKDKPLAETFYDRSLRRMLEIVQQEDLSLGLSVLYDSFCWYRFPRERIVEDLAYLAETYHGHPLMLHFDGRLVVFFYATMSQHTPQDWTAICQNLSQTGLRGRLFLIAGEIWVHRPDFHQPGLFDGFSAYNQGVNFLTPKDIKELALALKSYAQRNKAPFWSAPVQAGFDGRIWHHPGRVVARGMGELYESLWKAIIETHPPMVTVCSFNEWGEGTQIEPAQEYGDLYLRLTAKWTAQYKASKG